MHLAGKETDGIVNIRSMPKAELHLHLEGSVRLTTLRQAHQKHAGELLPETPWWLEDDFRFEDFDQFRALFRDYLTPWLTSERGFAEMTRDVLDSLVAQNIRYAEVNACPSWFNRIEVPVDEILALFAEETERVRSEGTVVRWIAGLNREEGAEEAAGWVTRLIDEPIIAGFDLHGTEPDWPPSLFAGAFAPVREAGKKLKIHAGEFAPSNYVREAVEIGATQIGHGLSAEHDPEVLALLAERGVVLECCPTSNERLRNIPTYPEHPTRTFEEAGVLVTINSDDAIWFGPNLTQELGRMVIELDARPDDLVRWMSNAIDVALLDPAMKETFAADLQQWSVEAGLS